MRFGGKLVGLGMGFRWSRRPNVESSLKVAGSAYHRRSASSSHTLALLRLARNKCLLHIQPIDHATWLPRELAKVLLKKFPAKWERCSERISLPSELGWCPIRLEFLHDLVDLHGKELRKIPRWHAFCMRSAFRKFNNFGDENRVEWVWHPFMDGFDKSLESKERGACLLAAGSSAL